MVVSCQNESRIISSNWLSMFSGLRSFQITRRRYAKSISRSYRLVPDLIILRLSHWFAVFSTMCAPLHRHVKCTAFVPVTLRQVTLCQSPENSDCAIGPCHAKVTWPDGFKLQYRKRARPSSKCKPTWASYYLVLCFETSQLLLPFIRRVLQLGNWQ